MLNICLKHGKEDRYLNGRSKSGSPLGFLKYLLHKAVKACLEFGFGVFNILSQAYLKDLLKVYLIISSLVLTLEEYISTKISKISDNILSSLYLSPALLISFSLALSALLRMKSSNSPKGVLITICLVEVRASLGDCELSELSPSILV